MHKNASRILLLCLFLLILLPGIALASDISGAIFSGTVAVSNAGTAVTNVSCNLSLNTQAMIDAGYINSGVNNTTIRTNTGSDTRFMPAQSGNSSWTLWVPDIGSEYTLNYVLYTGGDDMAGDIRYFPGASGMTTPDDASLEVGANFSITQKGWVNTDNGTEKLLAGKQDAFRTFVSPTVGGNITSEIGVWDGLQNFNSYTEVDANGKLTVTSTTATGVNVDRDEDVYLYKDFGANAFNALDIDFEIYLDSNTLADGYGGVALSNVINDISGFAATDFSVTIVDTGINNDIWLRRGVAVANDFSLPVAFDTPYYCTISRATGNDSVSVLIYTDTARTVLFDTLSVAGFGTAQWRYAYGFVNWNLGAGGQDWDGYTKDFDLHDIYSPSISVSAVGVSSSNHTISTTANTTHFWIAVDGVTQDTIALGGASVADNSANWTFVENGSMAYMESHEIEIGGVQAQFIEWEYGTPFTDQSVNANDAIPTFRTESSDIDVSASLINFDPITQAIATSWTLTEENLLITTTPSEPADLFTDLDVTRLFLGSFWDVLAGNAGDRATFWYPVAMLIIVGVGILMMYSTKSLITQTIAMGIVFFVLSFTIIPWWTMLAFIFYALGINIMAKQFGGI